MKLGALFSGGKDSTLALYKAMQKETLVCLISLVSENKESYMFHTPNNHLVNVQAGCMGLPIVIQKTAGVKEQELLDLKKAIQTAKEQHAIEGIVTGAVSSVYQAIRIQRICDELGLWCFSPLWQKDQIELLSELVQSHFEVMITGIFAEPFTADWLGKRISAETIGQLKKLQRSHGINPAGEGGEIETTVLDAPCFKKRILVHDRSVHYENHAGTFTIKETSVEAK